MLCHPGDIYPPPPVHACKTIHAKSIRTVEDDGFMYEVTKTVYTAPDPDSALRLLN